MISHEAIRTKMDNLIGYEQFSVYHVQSKWTGLSFPQTMLNWNGLGATFR